MLTKLTQLLDNVSVVVDKNALRFNQTALTALVVVGFVLGGAVGTVLVGVTGAALLVAAGFPAAAPFGLLYRQVFVRLGIIKPKREPDDPAPHRFAQLLGGIFLAAATILLAIGASAVGWVLAWIVVALALTNLVAGFCLGCFIFLQLARAGLIKRSVEVQ
jgi:hypothetical protein